MEGKTYPFRSLPLRALCTPDTHTVGWHQASFIWSRTSAGTTTPSLNPSPERIPHQGFPPCSQVTPERPRVEGTPVHGWGVWLSAFSKPKISAGTGGNPLTSDSVSSHVNGEGDDTYFMSYFKNRELKLYTALKKNNARHPVFAVIIISARS